MPIDSSLRNTVLFLLVFILAFFPNIFHTVLGPITYPFDLLSGVAFRTRQLTVCHCCPPVDCYQDVLTAALSSTSTPQTVDTIKEMAWFQKEFSLAVKSRGSYLITEQVVKQLPEIQQYNVGTLNLFIKHTSCGLSLNENWDSDVREDMSDALDRLAPEDRGGKLYRHSAEGLDDMPAHIKSALVGASVTVPITNGRLNLGTWQGIWYLEFRAAKHQRTIVATIHGEKMT